jgi:hypothetical protein
MRNCPRCNTEKELEEFYQKRGKAGASSYCKPCTTEQTIERQRELKRRAVEYKGGKCICCGYDRCQAALEFHHVDDLTKEFSLGHVKLTAWSSKITDELDKCELVCANCHREIHSGLKTL